MKLLVCDMDGVIFRGSNFWLDLHRALGTVDDALALWERMGRTRYRVLSRRTAALWRGRSAEPYFRLVRERDYVPGCEALIRFARARGARTAIISSGSWHLAERAQRELGIDRFFANRLGIDEQGRFDGSVDVQVDNNRKLRRLRELQAEFAVAKEDTVVIGDTESDAFMAGGAGLSIGYDVLDGAEWRFDHVVPEGSVAAALPYLIGYRGGTEEGFLPLQRA
jgi:HAD superfamily phosphoserine phosphatase-like hydrolase